MKQEIDNALKGFQEKRLSCAQAVLSAYAMQWGLPRGLAFKLATPFGGGMARTGQMCGAVSGALLVLGLALASENPEDKEAKDLVYEKAQQFLHRFRQVYGSIYCPDLIKCDLGTEEGRDRAEQLGVSKQICVPLVQSVISWLPAYFPPA